MVIAIVVIQGRRVGAVGGAGSCGCFGGEDGVFAFFVVDDKGAVHVGG